MAFKIARGSGLLPLVFRKGVPEYHLNATELARIQFYRGCMTDEMTKLEAVSHVE